MYATPATQTLKEEHKVIERVLKIIEVACQTLEKGEELSPEIFKKILDFMKNLCRPLSS